MRTLIAALALCFALPAFAVGPQDVTLTFQTRAGGGAVAGHRLYVNDVLAGAVTSGQAFSGAVPGNGTYKFCVNAFNATGETAGGACITRTLADAPPDAPAPTDVLTLTFQCETTSPRTCVVTLSP